MKPRRRIGERERMWLFLRADGVCHICKYEIDGTREAWEIDHVLPLEMGGDEEKNSENLQPAHGKCHRMKTSGEDVPTIRKAQRLERRHVYGIKRQPRNPLPGSKASRWKRKMDGTVERRE